MIKKIISLALVLVLGAGILILAVPSMSFAAGGEDSARDIVEKVDEAFGEVESVYQGLRNLISEEIAAYDSDDGHEYGAAEVVAVLSVLSGYGMKIRTLLSDLDGLTDDADTSEGKTVRAAREYLTLLLNLTTDLSELLGYALELSAALDSMASLYEEAETYQGYAQMISDVADNAIEALNMIDTPSYLVISHGDLVLRITELRDFADDYYSAAELEDPLRLYSCQYRYNRILRMFEICYDNLDEDLHLQVRQTEHRLEGPIALIHDELTHNLAVLANG